MDSDLPRRLFRAGLEPKGEKVNTYSVMTHLKELLAILKPDEIDEFKKNGFEKLFELAEKPKWSSRFGMFLLTRQIEVSKKNEIWVLFGGKPVRLSLREFKLVTGLKCGKLNNLEPKGSTPYYYTMFGRVENMTVKKVLAILNKRSTTNREMRLRYACLVIVDGLLLPTSQNSKINKDHADMVENLDTFFAHPWGRVSFDAMISSIKERSTWELAYHSVAVHGFFPALQLVVLEAAPAIQKQKKGQELEDSNSDDGVVVEIGSKNEVNLGNARILDEQGEVDVQSIIFPDVLLDAEEEDLSWSNDGVDERVDRMVKLVEENFLFNKSMFKGGCDPSKLVKPVKKQAKTTKPATTKGKKTKKKEKVKKGRRTSQRLGTTDGEQDDDESGSLTLAMIEDLLDSKLTSLRTIIRDELTEAFESHSKLIDTKLQKAETNVITKVTDWFAKNTSVGEPTHPAVDKVIPQTNPLQQNLHGSTAFASETAAYNSGIDGTATLGKHHEDESEKNGGGKDDDTTNPDEEHGEETGEEDEVSQEGSETKDEEDNVDENSKEPYGRTESPIHMVTQNFPEEDREEVFDNATDAQNNNFEGNDSVDKETEKQVEKQVHVDGGAQSEVPQGEEGEGNASKDGVVEGEKNADVPASKEVEDEVRNEGNVEALHRASKIPRTVSSKLDAENVSRRKQLNAENESTHVKDENVSTQPKARSSKKASDILTRTQPEIAESSEPAVPHVSRRKQLYAARLKAKRLERLKSRQFYHSQTKQPMTFEEVMSDADSENEADDHDTLDLNERLRLQRIVGASQEEKRYMYLWNIFVRKQRVIADGHMSWACEEFTKLYKEEMKGSSTFDWWWRLFKIKLWNHGLICANTINKCTTILRNLEEGLSTSQGASDANKQQPMEVDAE